MNVEWLAETKTEKNTIMDLSTKNISKDEQIQFLEEKIESLQREIAHLDERIDVIIEMSLQKERSVKSMFIDWIFGK
jgi:predicted solute-binding protein